MSAHQVAVIRRKAQFSVIAKLQSHTVITASTLRH